MIEMLINRLDAIILILLLITQTSDVKRFKDGK